MGYLQCVRVSARAAVRRSREAVNERNDVRKTEERLRERLRSGRHRNVQGVDYESTHPPEHQTH